MRVGPRVVVGAAAAISLYARGAAANGRLPASNHVVFAPADPDVVVTRATYGLLVSRDRGASWTFLCEEAVGLPSSATQDPPLGITAAPAVIVGTAVPFGGLDVSADLGCNWSCAGGALAGRSVVDIAVRPDAPHAVLALTTTFTSAVATDAAPSDAGPTSDTRVFESRDDGVTWEQLGPPIDPSVLPETVEVTASDPRRIYVSATRGFGNARTAWLLVSSDAGATWTERPIPLDASRNQTRAYVASVDPVDADRVYVRTDGRSTLLVSGDAGATFAAPLSLQGTMLGFALSPDGSAVYVGSVEDGLYAATRDALAFARRASIDVQCLAARAGELWACSDDQKTGFVVGVSTDEGVTFTPKLHLGSVANPLACAPAASRACGADANASQCGGPPFEQLCASLGCASPSSQGSTTGGGSGGATVASTSATSRRAAGAASASGGCGAAAGVPLGAAPAALVAAIGALAARRRRRKRRG